MKTKVLFLTLSIFSRTGGIEKVCRTICKALSELYTETGTGWQTLSMHDPGGAALQNLYFPSRFFVGYDGKKIPFVLNSIREGIKSRLVLLSHINLLLPGYLIKLFSPSTKLVLLAHGIEVWKPFTSLQKKMFKKVDLVLPVSNYTRDRMVELHSPGNDKLVVLNNCLDPFIPEPLKNGMDTSFLSRYGLTKEHTILLTLTRMMSDEKYKGYDHVLNALPELIKEHPGLRYLLAGKYDEQEKARLDKMIDNLGLNGFVVFTGFIADADLPAHFANADIFVMPSSGEGFGLVFIEAMHYGLPVIAGNKDGSVDALANGQLGILIDPGSKKELVNAINKVLNNRDAFLPDKQKLNAYFGYEQYKRKLGNLLNL